jgi:tetratricopeptide (TPR) repeat protein
MAQQQQLDNRFSHTPPKRGMHRTRWLIAIIALLLIAGGAIFWLVDTQGSLYAYLPVIIFTVLGVVIGLFQWLFPVGSGAAGPHGQPALLPLGAGVAAAPMPQIIVHMPAPEHADAPQAGQREKTSYRGIMGVPPPTDPRTIQQREGKVQEIFAKLAEAQVTALVLTGIGGAGKSTLAALVYRDAEAQRQAGQGAFAAPAVWLTIDAAVTMADLAGNLFEVFGKPLPDFANLALQHQARALFNVLNTSDQPRLVVLDQFENLLDIQTGHALADRPGVGEWLDAINSQPCACKILLTSRPWPQGTREYPPTYMQEYIVKGLELAEGIDLLRKLHIEGSDAELQRAVEHCEGHAFSLTLLASLLRTRHLKLSTFFNESIYTNVWTGNVARNLLDVIYQQQLNEEQRRLLLAFSVYRKPVQLDAAEALLEQDAQDIQMHSALDVLLNQHLLQAWGDGRYQLHAVVASYAQAHFVEGGEAASREALRAAHARAADHYAQYGGAHALPRKKRRQVEDVGPFIEAAWHNCQAERWLDAFDLMEREGLFTTLKRAGGGAVLLELYQALSLERWQPTPEQRARVYNNLGVTYRLLGRMEQALDYLEQALHMYQEGGNRSGEARTLNDLGRVYGEMGNRERARSDFETALRICQEQGDQQIEGSALNNLGWVFIVLGQDKQAQAYYEQALAIFREMGDRLGEGSTLNNLGRVYEDLGQREQAQLHYEQGLHIFREERDRKGEAWSLNNLGKVHRKLGQAEQALAYLQQALAIRREIDRKGEGRTLKNLGVVYETLGEKQQAGGYYRQALLIAREISDREGEGKALRNLGKIYLDLQRYDTALAALLLAQHILQEIRSTYFDESERGLDTLRKTTGDADYAALLAGVEPHAAEIVEEALRSGG